MVRTAIALGSNLGNRSRRLRFAIDILSTRLSSLEASAFIETDAEGTGPQPPFLNGALVGSWPGSARELLTLLMAVERDAGRERPYPGAPRTLDLDLVLFGSVIIDEPGLVVPHPRFRDRGFVLRPLREIAPDMTDPVTGRTVADLCRAWEERALVTRTFIPAAAVGGPPAGPGASTPDTRRKHSSPRRHR